MAMQRNFKTIDKSHIATITERLCNFFDKSVVLDWEQEILPYINNLFKKYQVVDFFVNRNSYMGIVMDCVSNTCGNIFIKVVPEMIRRFETEIETLRRLPNNLTCKIYEIDSSKCTLVMEKILPGELAWYSTNKPLLKNLFFELYNKKIEIDDYIDSKFLDFSEVVEHDYQLSKLNNCCTSIVECLYAQFLQSYKKVCDGHKKYLLHGDIYHNNAILSENGIKLIDPLGFKAPFVMELLPICAYDMFYNENNLNETLEEFSEFFKDYVDNDYCYKEALFCQLVKVYIPSLYEANDGGARANKWFKIIQELYPSKLKTKGK